MNHSEMNKPDEYDMNDSNRSDDQDSGYNSGGNWESMHNFLDALIPDDWSPSARKWVPIAAGGALALIGLSRKSAFGFTLAAAGGALAYYGSRSGETQTESVARGSVLLNCTPEEAYSRYRNFEDLPTFMKHLQSVTKIGERQYRWVARGPFEIAIQWDAEVFDEKVGESISWHSTPDSAITMEGSVRFAASPANRGTELTSVTRFDHPASDLAQTFAKLLGKDPSFLMQQDLRRFKALIETGEIPTTEGQSHGPRSAMDKAFEALDPDSSKRRESRMSETLNENWRTA